MNHQNEIKDEDLMELLQHSVGKKKNILFEVLYQRYVNKMLQFFYYSFLNNEPKAQDFNQELFLKVYEFPNKFDPTKKFKPWLYQVASNMVKNDFRKSATEKKYIMQQSYIESGLQNKNSESKESFAKLLFSLSEEQKSLIILRYKFKMSIREISEIIEKPEGTIRSKLFYALEEVRKRFNISVDEK